MRFSCSLVFCFFTATSISSVANAALEDSVIAYWDFDNDYTDGVGNHDGTESGSGSSVALSSDAMWGKSAQFSGKYLSIANATDFNVGAENSGKALTVAFWSKFPTTPGDNFRSMVGTKQNYNNLGWHVTPSFGNGNVYSYVSDSDGSYYGKWSGGDGYTGASGFYNQWWLNVVTIDRADDGSPDAFDIYVENVGNTTLNNYGTETLSANDHDTGQFLIGNFGNNLLIDDVTVWDRALSYTEAQQLFNGGNGIEMGTLVPEPTSFVLAGLALIGFAVVNRRRRK